MVVPNKDAKCTFKFWKSMFEGIKTQLNFSTTYHPQMDGQTKRANQVLEDMLRMYIMTMPIKLEDLLHLTEFTYKISYQNSIKMSVLKLYMEENVIHHSTKVNQKVE